MGGRLIGSFFFKCACAGCPVKLQWSNVRVLDECGIVVADQVKSANAGPCHKHELGAAHMTQNKLKDALFPEPGREHKAVDWKSIPEHITHKLRTPYEQVEFQAQHRPGRRSQLVHDRLRASQHAFQLLDGSAGTFTKRQINSLLTSPHDVGNASARHHLPPGVARTSLSEPEALQYLQTFLEAEDPQKCFIRATGTNAKGGWYVLMAADWMLELYRHQGRRLLEWDATGVGQSQHSLSALQVPNLLDPMGINKGDHKTRKCLLPVAFLLTSKNPSHTLLEDAFRMFKRAANVRWTTDYFFSDDDAAARKAVRGSQLATRFLGDQWHAVQNVKEAAKQDRMTAADFIILHHMYLRRPERDEENEKKKKRGDGWAQQQQMSAAEPPTEPAPAARRRGFLPSTTRAEAESMATFLRARFAQYIHTMRAMERHLRKPDEYCDYGRSEFGESVDFMRTTCRAEAFAHIFKNHILQGQNLKYADDICWHLRLWADSLLHRLYLDCKGHMAKQNLRGDAAGIANKIARGGFMQSIEGQCLQLSRHRGFVTRAAAACLALTDPEQVVDLMASQTKDDSSSSSSENEFAAGNDQKELCSRWGGRRMKPAAKKQVIAQWTKAYQKTLRRRLGSLPNTSSTSPLEPPSKAQGAPR